MESNPLECAICYNVFSQENSPRILPCSHTFCGPCIDGIIATQKKTCPNCREEFTAASAEDFMINRIALDAANKFGSVSVKPKTSSKGPTGSFAELPKESGNKLTEEWFQEKETRVLGEFKILEEMENVFAATETLREMKNGVLDTQKDIEKFRKILREIELSNEQILEKIKKEEEGLQAATDLPLTKPYQDDDEKVKIIKDVLRKNGRKRDNITKEINTNKREIGKVAEEMKKAFEVEPLVISAEGDVPPRVAVKVIGGKQMVAPVRVKPGNQVQLSHFAEGDVPPKSLIIKHESLMETSYRRAFLDLTIADDKLGRIIIKVMDEGNLALNFLHLCAGDLEPSYADSHISRVEWEGQDGERIWVNGYKTSGGNTSTAIMKQIDWNKEKQREIYKHTKDKAGDVRGVFSEGHASNFYIVTRDRLNWRYNNCFGIVEEGLDVLRDAIRRYPDIEAVRIVDCGLLLSM